MERLITIKTPEFAVYSTPIDIDVNKVRIQYYQLYKDIDLRDWMKMIEWIRMEYYNSHGHGYFALEDWIQENKLKFLSKVFDIQFDHIPDPSEFTQAIDRLCKGQKLQRSEPLRSGFQGLDLEPPYYSYFM